MSSVPARCPVVIDKTVAEATTIFPAPQDSTYKTGTVTLSYLSMHLQQAKNLKLLVLHQGQQKI